jgi:hypothetical protein
MSGSTCAVQGTIATSMAIMKTQSWIEAYATPTINWELTGSGAIDPAHNLRLTRTVVRREGIEPPTR